eukprot:gene58284-biopygen102067
MGGILAEPETSDQTASILDAIRIEDNGHWGECGEQHCRAVQHWIGFSDTAEEGIWRRASDGTTSEYTHWERPGEPNNWGSDRRPPECANGVTHSRSPEYADSNYGVTNCFIVGSSLQLRFMDRVW